MNSAPRILHLTEDQIDDALIGDLAADCADHLSGCEACQLRLAEAEAPIARFNEVSLAWSERRSATLPGLASASGSVWRPRALWAAAAAAVVAVGVIVPTWHRSAENGATASYHQAVDSAGPTLMASTGPVENSIANPLAEREEQIARDNQLLAAIDRELDAPPATFTSDLDSRSASPVRVSHHASRAVSN